MNVLIVDDHPLIRDGLADFLKAEFPIVKRTFEAENEEEAIKIVLNNPINIVFLDIEIKNNQTEGLQTLVKLKSTFDFLTVVIYSGYEEWSNDAIQKGAMGFISKASSRLELTKALQSVLSGQPYLPKTDYNRAKSFFSESFDDNGLLKPTSHEELDITPRQREVLRWVVHGCSNKEIARRLGIGEQGVRNHLRPIFDKFKVKSRTELIVAVYKQGIVLGSPEASNT